MGKNVVTAVAAKSDEEFEATRTKMIEELQKNYHVDEVFQYFYDEAVAQADDVAKLVEMNNAIKADRGTVKFILPRQESVYCKNARAPLNKGVGCESLPRSPPGPLPAAYFGAAVLLLYRPARQHP